MPPKTIKKAITKCLLNLSEEKFKKFCVVLRDRSDEPRIGRREVEGKDYLDVTDVMFSHFGEAKALEVVLELLEEINCNQEEAALVEETKELTKAGSSKSAGSSAGAAGVTPKSDEHFVDKHEAQLVQRLKAIAPILDQLLAKKVIQRETYSTIRAKPTPQEQMRELYDCLNAAPDCKDIFYEILEEQQPLLVADLKKKK